MSTVIMHNPPDWQQQHYNSPSRVLVLVVTELLALAVALPVPDEEDTEEDDTEEEETEDDDTDADATEAPPPPDLLKEKDDAVLPSLLTFTELPCRPSSDTKLCSTYSWSVCGFAMQATVTEYNNSKPRKACCPQRMPKGFGHA